MLQLRGHNTIKSDRGDNITFFTFKLYFLESSCDISDSPLHQIIFCSSFATCLLCQVIYKTFESCIDGHGSMTLLIIN